MSRLASPRFRRRLIWLGAVGAALLFIAGIAVVLPSRGTDAGSRRPPRAPTFGGGVPTASVPFETLPNAVSGETQSLLLAMRFEKARGRWSLNYVHEGHSSRYVTASNYSPSGFIPGTRSETRWTWLILAGGLVALVALAALAERALSPRSRTA
jgi:hypothetical protein